MFPFYQITAIVSFFFVLLYLVFSLHFLSTLPAFHLFTFLFPLSLQFLYLFSILTFHTTCFLFRLLFFFLPHFYSYIFFFISLSSFVFLCPSTFSSTPFPFCSFIQSFFSLTRPSFISYTPGLLCLHHTVSPFLCLFLIFFLLLLLQVFLFQKEDQHPRVHLLLSYPPTPCHFTLPLILLHPFPSLIFLCSCSYPPCLNYSFSFYQSSCKTSFLLFSPPNIAGLPTCSVLILVSRLTSTGHGG